MSIAIAITGILIFTRIVIPLLSQQEKDNTTYLNTDGSVDWDATHILNFHLAEKNKSLYEVLEDRAWLQDELAPEVRPVIEALMHIAYQDEEIAVRLADMSFLDILEPSDVPAVEAMTYLFFYEHAAFQEILRHPALADGITDEEAKVVGLLGGVHEVNPSLVYNLLDLSKTIISERDIELPLAGDVTLAIIRTEQGTSNSMDFLEYAVRETEPLMEHAFPTKYVALLFEESVPDDYAGIHQGTFISILPGYDDAFQTIDPYGSSQIIAHEVAHYYWRYGKDWFDEGAAEFTASYIERKRANQPPGPANYPCHSSKTLHNLENLRGSEVDANAECNYAVGERLFHDLYNYLGEEAFRRGVRRLYLSSQKMHEENAGPAGIYQLRQAFKKETDSVGMPDTELVDQVIDRWYVGRDLETKPLPFSQSAATKKDETSNLIGDAYVSLSETGSPLSIFSANEANEWIWLSIEFSRRDLEMPQEYSIEIVEYFEDGFPYRRTTLPIPNLAHPSDTVEWPFVGPGPGQPWLPGRHWIRIYHRGQMEAQVEFEVVP